MESTEILDKKTGELIPTADIQDRKLVFGTQDPERIIERATVVANRLADIVEKAKLYSMISGRKYVRAEGWTAMIAMLGVFPSAVWSNRLDRTKDEIAYEAKIVLRHLSGHTLGEGSAMCSSNEKNWHNRDEFAIKSMAQTRAVGKACRLSFSWIMALAGYEGTPFEEMDSVTVQAEPLVPESGIEFPETQEEVQAKTSNLITEKQQGFLFAIWRKAGHSAEELQKHLNAKYGIDHSKDLTRTQLEEIKSLLDLEKK